MPIRVKCEQCKKTLSVKDHLAGKKIKCPVCQSVIAVSSAPPAKGPAPKAGPAPAKPASSPAAKKPAPTAKPAAATKPPVDKTKSNGTPGPSKAGSNGVAPKPPAPEPIELPPENVEAEAAAAFADEPKPLEEDTTPKTIDFRCQWCDEELHLPIELAGKQSQCPNADCRRIIKVPLPKVVAKKDWRKMDRQGPAAAIVNQPEQPEDAWGSQDATKARQSSLAQAGVLPDPKKKPLGLAGWIRIGFIGASVLVLLVAAGFGFSKLWQTNQQHHAVKEIEKLVTDNDLIKKQPLLAAQAYRTMGLYQLKSDAKNPAKEAKEQFFGAQSLVKFEVIENEPALHEQAILIEIALSQIEMGGDDEFDKKQMPWNKVRDEVLATLNKIKSPEARVIALRVVGARLVEKGQVGMAIGLAGEFSNIDSETNNEPPAKRQHIAFVFWKGGAEAEKTLPKKPDEEAKKNNDSNARVGYAEGHARKGEYDEAFKLAEKGEPAERLDAYLGVAAVALQDRKKTVAADAVEKAVKLIEDQDMKPSPWQQLQLVQLCARTENAKAKDFIKGLPTPFERRAQLEIVLALCDKSAERIDPDILAELETNDKEGTTLALAWLAVAQHNARKGASRDQNRKTLDGRTGYATAPIPPELLRAAVDIGFYLGATK